MSRHPLTARYSPFPNYALNRQGYSDIEAMQRENISKQTTFILPYLRTNNRKSAEVSFALKSASFNSCISDKELGSKFLNYTCITNVREPMASIH